MKFLRVAIDVPLPQLFDYRCDEAATEDIGCRVLVPFGRKKVVGVIVEVVARSDHSADKLRSAERILRDVLPLSAEWIELARFCSGYYQRSLGEVMLAALPPRLRNARPLRATKQKSDDDAARPAAPPFVERHRLTAEQLRAIDSISASAQAFGVFLLFGVTGSGKTEVYLRLIAGVLARGAQALVLVPEIALTPALQTAFRERFPGATIVVQHSAMAEGARARGWIEAQSGSAQIVLGTRLAVFAPLPRLGLLVVDEEQDPSFKQQESLRYSARDVAIVRARAAGIPIVLCSATPSLESWRHAQAGRYALLRLSRRARADSALPEVRMVDTRTDASRDGISGPLAQAIGERLARSEQTLIFLNRRGYAPVLSCAKCGWISGCKRCSARLVVHLKDRELRCHHCGDAARIPRACPECGNLDLQPVGRGTQRLEASLAERFPRARILRMDRDTVRHRGSLEAMFARIEAGEADILVGTQILAKGHHFENLTLVGVVDADAGLYAADYRAPERMFAQLEQVSGRAGRAGVPGEVILQTRYPNHPLYQALVRHDFEGYAQILLDERRQAEFPPYVFEAALRAEALGIDVALGFLRAAATRAPSERDGVTVYDPSPMMLERLAGRARAQLIVQAHSRVRLQLFLREWRAELASIRAPAVRWHLDVDPTEF
jgi:primosomal protein N' (replication factor Y)